MRGTLLNPANLAGFFLLVTLSLNHTVPNEEASKRN